MRSERLLPVNGVVHPRVSCQWLPGAALKIVARGERRGASYLAHRTRRDRRVFFLEPVEITDPGLDWMFVPTQWLPADSAWAGHIPFAHWLVAHIAQRWSQNWGRIRGRPTPPSARRRCTRARSRGALLLIPGSVISMPDTIPNRSTPPCRRSTRSATAGLCAVAKDLQRGRGRFCRRID